MDAARKRATYADYEPRMRREEPYELVDGELVYRATTAEHGAVQTKLAAVLDPFHRKPGGPRGPGGWWIVTEVDTRYAATDEVFRHDVSGYRRDAHPDRPTGWPLTARPDWVCEVLSPSTARVDLVKKQRTLHGAGVPHFWVVDPERKTLTVLRHHADGYVTLLTAGPGETVRAEPFAEVGIETDEVFGDV